MQLLFVVLSVFAVVDPGAVHAQEPLPIACERGFAPERCARLGELERALAEHPVVDEGVSVLVMSFGGALLAGGLGGATLAVCVETGCLEGDSVAVLVGSCIELALGATLASLGIVGDRQRAARARLARRIEALRLELTASLTTLTLRW